MTDTDPLAPRPDIRATGIRSHDMYRASRAFVTHIHSLRLGTDALRLLHALLHATCRDLDAWSPESRQPEGMLQRPCLALRRLMGTAAANCNRGLKAGALELLATGLFDVLGYAHGNSWLCWRFTDALAMALDDRRYGLFDASFLSRIETRAEFFIHSEIALVRRMRRAAFTFDTLAPGAVTGGTRAGWSAMSRPVLEALRRCASRQDLIAVVLLDCEGYSRGIDTVHVRLRKPGHSWTVRDLARINPTTRRSLIVDGAGAVEVGPGDLEPAVRRVAAATGRGRRRPGRADDGPAGKAAHVRHLRHGGAARTARAPRPGSKGAPSRRSSEEELTHSLRQDTGLDARIGPAVARDLLPGGTDLDQAGIAAVTRGGLAGDAGLGDQPAIALQRRGGDPAGVVVAGRGFAEGADIDRGDFPCCVGQTRGLKRVATDGIYTATYDAGGSHGPDRLDRT